VGECNSHSQKWRLGVLQDSQKFKRRFEGSNLFALMRSLYQWKALEAYMSKMASYCPFGYLQPKLWAKERPGVKLLVWLPTIKSLESTSSRRLLEECDTALESSRRELQLWFRDRLDPSLRRGVVVVQSPGLQPETVSKLQLASLGKKGHLDVASVESCREYYMGEGGGFPRVQAVVSQVVQVARGLSQHPRVFPNVN
jgi:hypothetical protein